MLQRIWRRPSPATVIALIALFVALGGPAQAARLVSGPQIRNRSISTIDLNRGTIRFLRQVPARSVRTAQIVDGQVLARDLAAGAVTSAGVADGSLRGGDLAGGTVGAAQLAPGAVTASRLSAGSVSGASLADGTLQTVDIGSFAGSVQVAPNFSQFTAVGAAGSCQTAVVTAPTAVAQPQPNIADDVIIVTPPVGWPDQLVVTGIPGAGNQLRIAVCNASNAPITAPSPTIFRYATIDSP